MLGRAKNLKKGMHAINQHRVRKQPEGKPLERKCLLYDVLGGRISLPHWRALRSNPGKLMLLLLLQEPGWAWSCDR